MLKSKVFIIHFILIITLLACCKTTIEKAADEIESTKTIRVKLIFNEKIKIRLDKDIIVNNAVTGDNLIFNKKNDFIIIEKTGDKVLFNREEMNFPVKIYSIENKLIRINNTAFFGEINITPINNSFEIINIIPVETYLMSVILSEIPISFNMEAVKAQAIVARTYAQLFIDKYNDRREFDVDNTTSYQVYKGYYPKLKYKYVKKLKQAIDETQGMIIVHDGEPILAYFHSNSGGKIRSGKDYFGAHSDFPYLVSHDDPYSINYPGSKWEYKIARENFNSFFDLTGDISQKEISYNSDGFVNNIKLNNKIYNSKEIRKILGYTKVKSERFKIYFNQDGEFLLFSGIGYGHGVGMSQWGAHGMAENGYNFKDIIRFYYPYTELKKIY